MRLVRVRLRRSPGIEQPFELGDEQLDRPVVLVVGPNGTGKTSLCRAIETLLWPQRARPGARVEIEASLAVDGGRLEASHHPDAGTRWWRDGTEAPAPSLPAEHLAPCFTLGALDLLKRSPEEDDRELTARIRRQLAGGYDLDGLVEDRFAASPRAGQTERNAYRDAQDALSRRRREEGELAASEGKLAELRREAERAERAAEQVARLDARLELLAVRERIAEQEQSIERELPAGMDRLDGSEGRRLEDLRQSEAQLEQDRRAAEERRLEAQRGLELAALDDPLPDDAELEAGRERARRAEEVERRLAEEEQARARAVAAVDGARRAVGAPPDAGDAAGIGGEDLDRAEQLAEELDRAAARRDQLAAERERLATESFDEAAARARERAERILEQWLTMPAGAPGAWRPAVPAALLALLLGAAGVLLARELPEAGWAAAAAAVALAGWTGFELWRPVRHGRQRRARLEQEFADLRQEPPASWDGAGVAARLDALREQRAADARARHASERALELRADLERAEAELSERRGEAERLRGRAGIQVPAGAARTAALVRLVWDWQRARAELERVEAGQQALREELAAHLEPVNALLARHGLDPAADATEARTRIDDLAARAERAKRARMALREALERLSELDQRESDLARRREELFAGAGLDPDDVGGLQRRLELLEDYRQACNELGRLRAERARLEARVGAEPPGGGEQRAALEAERRQLAETAARRDDVRREIHRIETLVEQARHGERMQQALADRDEARQRLIDRRQQLAHRAAGRVLVRHVAERHRLEQQPELLRQASGLFARFTGHRYELSLAAESDGGRLRARESAAGRELLPSQLSDGTRAQLLLALRLAFARSVESGPSVPLLLDEALVASDPERFDAIAASLLDLAYEENRQVIFLTADPVDAARWNALLKARGLAPARPVDLLALRRGQRAADAPLPALPPAPPAPPEPQPGEGPARYGRRLGVAAPDPWAGIDGWHPLHVWPDDLAAVHALVAHGFDRVGAWRAFRRQRPADPGPLSPGAADRLDADAAVAEATLEAWRVGRGRPLERDALEAAEGVSETFLETLWEKSVELDRDAARLIDALRRGEVKNFRTSKIDQLEEELRDGGQLDRRAPLSRERLIARVRTTLESRGVAAPEFTDVVERIEAVLAWLPDPPS